MGSHSMILIFDDLRVENHGTLGTEGAFEWQHLTD